MITTGRFGPRSEMAGGRAGGCTRSAGGDLGIALSGGGARAMAQLGVLKVLDREGIPVSFIAGTSIGAMIGALYATSDSALHAEERLLAHLATDRISLHIDGWEALRATHTCHSSGFLDLVDTLWRAARPRGGLIGAAAIRASLRQLLGEATFAETRLPFAATAFDLVSGRLVLIVEGSLVEAVYASSAIAGLLEPSSIEGHVLVDGGLAEPVPVNPCHHLGAIHVLAIDVTGPRIQEAEAGAVSTDLLADALTRQLLGERQLGEADLIVRPQCIVEHFADVHDPAGLIASGERAAEGALPEIAAVLDRHRSRLRSRPDRRGIALMPPSPVSGHVPSRLKRP